MEEDWRFLFPNWMNTYLSTNLSVSNNWLFVYLEWTRRENDEETGLEGIEKLREFWNSIGAPTTISMIMNIDDS